MKSDEILIKTFDQVKNDNFDQVKFDQVIVCQIYALCKNSSLTLVAKISLSRLFHFRYQTFPTYIFMLQR
jgi:hypothetical protein